MTDLKYKPIMINVDKAKEIIKVRIEQYHAGELELDTAAYFAALDIELSEALIAYTKKHLTNRNS